MINEPIYSNQGIYRCLASNVYGRIISDFIVLRMAYLSSFPSKDQRLHRIQLNQPLMLKCRMPKSYPPPQVYWTKSTYNGFDMPRVKMSNRISVDFNGYLYFSNVQLEDLANGDNYVCMSNNEFLRSQTEGNSRILIIDNRTDPVNITAIKLMWSSPIKDIAFVGHNKILKCIFSGFPTPMVTWSRLTGKIDNRMRTNIDGHEFIIESTNVEDAGLYRCNGASGSDSASQVIQLLVESPPTWGTTRLSNVIVSEENEVFLVCNVTGIPSPDINWFINGIPIKEVPKNKNHILAYHYIKIARANYLTDIQTYQCNASNIHGYVYVNAFLKVSAIAPKFSTLPVPTKTIALGHSVSIYCNITGSPKPNITWKRNKGQINYTSRNFMLSSNNQELSIKSANFAEADIYNCYGKNKFGVIYNSTEIFVIRRTKIITKPFNITANVSSTILFQCEANAFSSDKIKLNYYWYKNGILLSYKSDSRYKFTRNTFTIQNVYVNDTNTYLCNATNQIDYDIARANLIVMDRPLPPDYVQILVCNSSYVELEWAKSIENNSPLLRYIIYYNTTFDKKEILHKTESVKPSKTKATLHLQPYTNYSFHVTAINIIGESGRTTTKEWCNTPETRPFRNPIGVCTDIRDCRKLIIIWQPLQRSEINGDNFYYLVSYQALNFNNQNIGSEIKQVVGDWRSSEVIIDMENCNFKKFQVYVQSVNKHGFSLSNIINVKIGFSGEEKPKVRPSNLRLNHEMLIGNQAELYWDPVDVDANFINGIFKGYQIQAWLSEDPSVVQEVDVIICPEISTLLCSAPSYATPLPRLDTSPVKGFLSNLWANSLVVVGVLVLNANFRSDLSDTIEFRTYDAITYHDSEYNENGTFPSTKTTPYIRTVRHTTSPIIITKSSTALRNDLTMQYDNSTVTDYYDVEVPNVKVTRLVPKRDVYRRRKYDDPKPAKWFIGMMSAITLLLILLIIVCILKRRKGQRYLVHEREKTKGRELDWPNLKNPKSNAEVKRRFAIGRVRKKKHRTSRSMDSDTSSLKEYDENGDMATFLEDGSFIGKYCYFKATTPDPATPILSLEAEKMAQNALSTIV